MSEFHLWIISWIFTIAFYVIYMCSIFRGETKPHMYSAFLYFLLSMMPFYIQLQSGAWYGAVYFWISTLFWGIIFLLSFKYGFEWITVTDKISLVFALLTGFFLIINENPFYVVILILLVDTFSSYPTVRKTYYHPQTENRYGYLIESIWVLTSIFALSVFDFINGAHLVYIFLFDILMFLIVFYRRKN